MVNGEILNMFCEKLFGGEMVSVEIIIEVFWEYEV